MIIPLSELNFLLNNRSDCGGADYLYMGAPSSAPAFVPIPVKLERKKSRRENHTDYLVMLLNNRGNIKPNIVLVVELQKLLLLFFK